MAEANKYFTFFQGTKTENGKVFATAKVTLSNITEKTVGEHELVSARAVLENRTKRVNDLLGIELPEDEKLWIDVNFWDERAQRFTKFLAGADRVRVCIVGNMASRTYTKADGTEGVGVSLSVSDWFRIPDKKE